MISDKAAKNTDREIWRGQLSYLSLTEAEAQAVAGLDRWQKNGGIGPFMSDVRIVVETIHRLTALSLHEHPRLAPEKIDFFSRECPFTGQLCIMRACERACSALRERSPTQNGDFRWLIEAPGPKYLGFQKLTSYVGFQWVADASEALAFRSKQQADAAMAALRNLDRELDAARNYGKLCWGIIFGFEPSIGNARAVEHAWMPALIAEKDRSDV